MQLAEYLELNKKSYLQIRKMTTSPDDTIFQTENKSPGEVVRPRPTQHPIYTTAAIHHNVVVASPRRLCQAPCSLRPYIHTPFWKMDILHRCRHHHNSHCTHAMLYTRELQATSRVARFQQCHSLNPMQMALGSTSIVATRTYRAAQHYSTSSTRPLNTETIYHFKALS